jgi:hypothetical protein
VALKVLVVSGVVYKWSKNSIFNPYPVYSHTPKYVLWRVDPFLGNDSEMSNYTAVVDK